MQSDLTQCGFLVILMTLKSSQFSFLILLSFQKITHAELVQMSPTFTCIFLEMPWHMETVSSNSKYTDIPVICISALADCQMLVPHVCIL